MSISGSSSSSSPFGKSLLSTAELNETQKKLQTNFAKLSSGSRINSASDDPAGLSISDSLNSDAVVLSQANQNISDGQSAINQASSAIGQVSDITDQLQQLAAEASNGTLNDQQRSDLNNQYQQLTQQIQQIGGNTSFNGSSLLTGAPISVQSGDDGSSNSQTSTNGVDVSGLAAGLTSQAIDTTTGAQNALTALSNFASSLSSSQASLGSTSSALSFASSNNSSQALNETAASSQIRDADVASTTAENVSLQVRSQVQTALAAQAGNINTQAVSDLLK